MSKLKVCVVLMLVLVLIASGCTSILSSEEDDWSNTEDRFEITYFQDNVAGITTDLVIIFQDKETGVQYLYVRQGYGGGLCVMPTVE